MGMTVVQLEEMKGRRNALVARMEEVHPNKRHRPFYLNYRHSLLIMKREIANAGVQQIENKELKRWLALSGTPLAEGAGLPGI